jgi:hypothetical protein
MRRFLGRASKTSYLVGSVLGLVHFSIAWWVIVRLALGGADAQWQLVWFLFLPFDLPFSLLVFFSGSFFPDWSISSLPHPVSELRDFILPAFIHGVVGPLWYLLLPIAVSSLRRSRQPKRIAPGDCD